MLQPIHIYFLSTQPSTNPPNKNDENDRNGRQSSNNNHERLDGGHASTGLADLGPWRGGWRWDMGRGDGQLV